VILSNHDEEVVVQLLAGNAGRLVDQTMKLAVNAPSGPVGQQTQGDRLKVSTTAAGAGPIRATAGDGLDRDFPVNVGDTVAAAGPIVYDFYKGQPIDRVTLGGRGAFCFRARHAGVAVAGVRWAFQGTSELGLERSSLSLDNCVDVRGLALGTGTLTVDA